MSSIMIRDLAQSKELDHEAMSAVRGGNSWLQGLGPVANVNVNVGVDQSIIQLQNVNVNALNNVGVIGAGFGPLNLAVNPKQIALAGVVF